jgi:hypothetical protein
VDAVRATLTEPEFRRLVLNEWAERDDALTTLEDVAALVAHPGPLEPVAGRRYVLALDIGLRNDATVLVVAHLATHRGVRTVVVDRVWRWKGTRLRPVQLSEVEATITTAWKRYGRARLIVDPWQAASLVERLSANGVKVKEYTFSPTSIDRLARTMLSLIRDRRLALPNDPELLSELAAARLVEVRPGVVRIEHDRSGHDDQVIAVALASSALLETPATSRAYVRGAARAKPPVPGFVAGREVLAAVPLGFHRGGGR